MEPEYLVIVDQVSSPPQDLPALLKTLHHEFNLDAYGCRQRLLGRTQALLCKGNAEQMRKIAACLHGYNIKNYCFTPTAPKFAPFLLNRLDAGAENLILHGRDKQLTIARGARTLILLADLSGKLAGRQINQLLSAHRYRGTTHQTRVDTAEWQKTILQGRPVLDIYLLDAQGVPQGAARALPGKFDHHGLGAKATLSASQNLLKLADLVCDYAPTSRTDLCFGVTQLPGASLRPAAPQDLEGLKKNLRNLTRYGWLKTDLHRATPAVSEQTNENEELAAGVTGLLTAIDPTLTTQQLPLEELGRHLSDTSEPQPTPAEDPAELPPTLPAPPELQHHSSWQSPQALIGLGVFATIALLSLLGTQSQRFTNLVGTAAESGALTGIGAFLGFLFGFRTLHLKRLIENTPTSKIRSLAMGLVEIKGTARRQYALFSPMSHIACVYYRLTRYKRNQKNQWVVSSIISSGQVPFWVEDETGRVCVEPRSAKIKAGHRQESFGESGSTLGGFHTANEKWCEEIIYDGALIYVLGKAQVKHKPISKQQRRAQALQQLKRDTARRQALDLNGDGTIDEEEWQVARDAVEQQLHHEDLKASNKRKRQEDQIVIGRDELKSMPFVIAETATETHLTARYAVYAGCFLGFALLASGATLWLIIK